MNKTQKTVNPSKIVKKLDNKYDYKTSRIFTFLSQYLTSNNDLA